MSQGSALEEVRVASSAKAKLLAAGVILLALILVPAPLLPPHHLSEAVEAVLGISWQAAYFVAALGLRSCFYGALGVLAAFTVKRAPARRGLWLQIVVVPVIVIGTALLIRSLKVGYMPEWINTVIPIAACLVGVALGFGFAYRAGKVTSSIVVGPARRDLGGVESLDGSASAADRGRWPRPSVRRGAIRRALADGIRTDGGRPRARKRGGAKSRRHSRAGSCGRARADGAVCRGGSQ